MAHRYSRKQFLDTLYAAIARDDRFDDIEGAERRGIDTILVYPFVGPALRITVNQAEEGKQVDPLRRNGHAGQN